MQAQKLQYGNDFLVKLIASVLTDRQFLLKTMDLEIEKYIESEPHKWFIVFIIQFFKEYKIIAGLDAIKIKIDGIKQPLLKHAVSNAYLAVIQTLDEIEPHQLGFIKDTAITFCRSQEIKFAIMKSIDILQTDEDFESIYDLINKTRFKGLDSNLGVQYVDSFYDRHTLKPEKTIQTPWPVINTALKGGLKQSRLYVILAPPGVGKSWMFCNIAAHAMKCGKKVVYYSLQMTQHQIGARIDSKLTGETLEFIRHPKNIDRINQELQKYRQLLRIKEFIPNKTRLVQCENHYNQLKLFDDFQADLIIIDYGDILKKEGNLTNMYTSYGDIFIGMKALSKQYKVPVVTGSQGGRDSIQSEIVLGNQTSHSMGKIQISDVVLSVSRTHSDKMSNTARFTMVKNRGGSDGMVYNGTVDLAIGDIKIHDVFTKESVQSREKMDNNDTLIKQRMKERLQVLQQNKNNGDRV